jgi:hypothetical protein
MTTEEEHPRVIGDVSPKRTSVDNTVGKEEDKISVGDMDEVNLEEGMHLPCCGDLLQSQFPHIHGTTILTLHTY